MVTVDSTCQSCPYRHQEERVGSIEDTDDDRQDERHGTPGRTHSEADEGCYHEDHCGEEIKRHTQVVQEAGYEFTGTQEITAHTAQAPSQH